MPAHPIFRALVCLGLTLMLTVDVAAQFSADSRWVPNDANCLVLVNSSRIFSSPLAVREDWASSKARAFERGLTIVPTDQGRVMLASEIDYSRMEPIWTVGVFYDEGSSINLQSVAERNGQEMEELAGRQAVNMPGDHFLVQLEPNVVGMIAPANRQTANRWILDREVGGPRLSKYLDDALAFADRNADIIIAFDLTHAISASEARTRLLGLQGLRASDIQTFANAVSRLNGVTLGISIRDSIVGSLRIDFRAGTESIDRISKDLILQILASQGLMIDELDNWELTAEASRLTLRGPLTTTGLRHVSLLVNQPVRAQLSGTPSPGSQASQEVSVGRATREFIDTLQLFFRELDEHIQNPRRKNANVYARWFNKYADKIDMLSVAGTDPEVFPLISDVSAGFREIAQVLISAEARTRSRQSQERGNLSGGGMDGGGMGGGGFGGFGYRQTFRTNASVQRATRIQETADAMEDAKSVMQTLRVQMGDVRRQMSIKYPQDF